MSHIYASTVARLAFSVSEAILLPLKVWPPDLLDFTSISIVAKCYDPTSSISHALSSILMNQLEKHFCH